jgi:hypothetical protein
MKKIILLSGIVIATLVSCSPEENSTYEQNQNKKIFNRNSPSSLTPRPLDSIYMAQDSAGSEPVKPIKD